MSVPTTRRDFVKLGAAGLAVTSQPLSAFAQVPGPISVQQSAGTKRFANEPDLKWRGASTTETDIITVDFNRTYQETLGFDAAMIWVLV